MVLIPEHGLVRIDMMVDAAGIARKGPLGVGTTPLFRLVILIPWPVANQ